jgi:phosphatidylglycerophosphatase C
VNLALFDFDGTVTFGDTFTPFLRRTASPSRRALGVPLLSPLVVAYRLGWLGASQMRAAASFVCFRGRAEADVRACGERYATGFGERVRPESLARIRWHRDNGDTVVIVSASLDAYLRGWCRELGLELICTELESKRGTLTGRYRGGDCTGPEKARRVREQYDLARYETVYAYGDTAEDRELLALASERYFCGRKLEP